MNSINFIVLCVSLLFLYNPLVIYAKGGKKHRAPTEDQRVREWLESNNTWPPRWQNYNQDWRRAMKRKEEELLLLPGSNERWENFMQYTQSLLVPRFTTHGFEVINTPIHVQTKLKALLDDGLENWENLQHESKIDAVYTPLPSKFIHLGRLMRDIGEDLLSYHEAWSELKLVPTSTYGIRLYQNGSSLVMHHDKVCY
jgi:hypothetical protein